MGSEAISLYRRMPDVMRNAISDVCVLNACSHAGLIDEARTIFNSIGNKTEQIFATMVRLDTRWTETIVSPTI